MPKKKTTTAKKITKKPTKQKVSVKGHDWHLLIVLVIFAVFALYAVASFFNSTNDYLAMMKTSVVDSEDDEIDAPAACQTCPGSAVCSEVCVNGRYIYGDEEEKEKNTIKVNNGDGPAECQTCPDSPVCSEYCEEAEVYKIFEDVDSTHPQAVAIEALVDKGILSGYEDGTFKPGNKITRAEALKVMTELADIDFGGGVFEKCFLDVEAQWFAHYVCYSASRGWVTGYANKNFGPNNTVTKAEALKIAFSVFQISTPTNLESKPFDDVELTDWYAPYAFVAKKNAFIKTSGNFDAGYEMTRSDFAGMIYKIGKATDAL